MACKKDCHKCGSDCEAIELYTRTAEGNYLCMLCLPPIYEEVPEEKVSYESLIVASQLVS